MKKIFALVLLLLFSAPAFAQFAPGVVLRAADLNAALAAPNITAGTINNAPIGLTTPSSGQFTTLISSSYSNTGQYLGADGSAASPEFSFTSDQDIGMYRAAANSLGFATDGALQFLVSTVGGTTVNYLTAFGRATANAPILSATGSDANVGMELRMKGTGTFSVLSNAGASTAFQALTSTTSDVNYLAVQSTNAGTATGNLFATGASTNIDVAYATKGSGTHRFFSTAVGSAEQFRISHIASSVNFLQAQGAATLGSPIFSVQGSDTNIGMEFRAKGNAGQLFTNNGGPQFLVSQTLNSVNYLGVSGSAATASSTNLYSTGTDANIDIAYSTKAAGSHRFFSSGIGGAEQFRVVHTASAVDFIQVSGSAAQEPSLSAVGASSAISLNLNAKGGGVVRIGNAANGTGLQVTGAGVSSVNYLQANGSATGVATTFGSQGSDANIDSIFYSKGTGNIRLMTVGGTTEQVRINNATSAVNYLALTGAATGGQPSIASRGSDPNIPLVFGTQGTGRIAFVTDSLGASSEQFRINHTANAVNFILATGAATGANPFISAAGTDSDVGLEFSSKGTDPISFSTNGFGAVAFQILHAASAVNSLRVAGSATGAALPISATGADTDVSIQLTPKGAGRVVAASPVTITTGAQPNQIRTAQTTPPTCSTNCGTSPSIVGTDTAMLVTMGATGSPASGWVVTFNGTWAAAPSCVVQMAKTGMVVGKQALTAVASTGVLTVVTNGTAPANADVYAVHCFGVQ